eukprot:scaffold168580_cov30-Tisochrysis_lutea.AAC.3
MLRIAKLQLVVSVSPLQIIKSTARGREETLLRLNRWGRKNALRRWWGVGFALATEASGTAATPPRTVAIISVTLARIPAKLQRQMRQSGPAAQPLSSSRGELPQGRRMRGGRVGRIRATAGVTHNISKAASAQRECSKRARLAALLL